MYRVNISSWNTQTKPGLLPRSRRRRTPACRARSASWGLLFSGAAPPCWNASGRELTGRFPQGRLSLPEQASCKLVLDVSVIIPQVHEARPVCTWSVCSALTRDMLRNSFDPCVFTETTAAHNLHAPARLAAVCSAHRPEGKQGDNQIIRTKTNS